jgi:hypothetical protein
MLLFRVQGSRRGFLSAYAVPSEGGERVWFFPRENGSLLALSSRAEGGILSEGVKLRSLAPGRYAVHVVLSDEPLSRAAVLAAASQIHWLEVEA